MPKMPRDISGRELPKLLHIYKYKMEREKGSHIADTEAHKKVYGVRED